MYEGLYAPLPDAGLYLRRLGLERLPEEKIACLDLLVNAHQRRVAFENIDLYDAGRNVSLAIPDIFEKVVVKGHGGYCFELNALFMSLLQALGYDCYAVAARVVWRFDHMPPLSHRATIVTVAGRRYYCDVGFGGPSPNCALLLEETASQQVGNVAFQFARDGHLFRLNRLAAGKKEAVMIFSELPVDPVDFLPLSHFQARGNGRFQNNRIVSIRTEAGCCSLENNLLRITEGDTAWEKELVSVAELRQALQKYFGLQPDFPLRMEEE